MPANLNRAGGGAEEGLHHAVPAQAFLERALAQGGIGAQTLPLIRMQRERVDHIGDAVDRGVEPGGQERADQPVGLIRRTFTPIGGFVNLRGLPWFFGKNGVLSRMRRQYLDWFKKDFHPSQHPPIAQYQVWVQALQKTSWSPPCRP